MWSSPGSSIIEIGAAQLLSVTEIVPESLLLCVNRSPIRYSFRAGARAIRYGVNTALTRSGFEGLSGPPPTQASLEFPLLLGVACEQALLVSLERTRERGAEGLSSAARSRVLARLASLAQIGELARRLLWGFLVTSPPTKSPPTIVLNFDSWREIS